VVRKIAGRNRIVGDDIVIRENECASGHPSSVQRRETRRN
jgi:hypothetical protein